MDGVDGVLLDIDGVLTVSWEPLPGAAETLAWLRGRGLPFRLITNTTTHTRAALSTTLSEAGLDVPPEQIVTAVVATASYLRDAHPGATVFLLSDGNARGDLEGVDLVDGDAEVVVIGGASERFDYPTVNRVFQMVLGGATLVAMHRNMYWRTSEGLQLDGGAYVAALEEAANVRAVVCGKPSTTYFGAALAQLGVAATRAAMVGDDLVNDVLGAQAAGLSGVLVKTGKFRASDLDAASGEPDAVLDSIADLPELLERS